MGGGKGGVVTSSLLRWGAIVLYLLRRFWRRWCRCLFFKAAWCFFSFSVSFSGGT